MHTQPPGSLITSAALQTPLLSAGQLTPGTILTGPLWQKVMEVVEVTGETLVLRDLAVAAPPREHAHIWDAVRGSTATTCACGLRRSSTTSLLPTVGTIPRTYLICPSGPLLMPARFGVYLAADGTEVLVAPNGQWQTSGVPIIPALFCLWQLPPGLARMLGNAARAARRAEAALETAAGWTPINPAETDENDTDGTDETDDED